MRCCVVTTTGSGYERMSSALVNSAKKNAGIHVSQYSVGDYKVPHNVQPEIINENLKYQNVESVLWLDADTIVRDSLYDIVNGADLSFMYRPKLEDKFKTNSGVVFIRNNEGTRRMVSIWHALVIENPIYMADQLYLWKAYNYMKDEIRFSPLDTKYNDCHFNDKSIIWHGKGSSRLKKKWKKEVDRYADM